MAFLRLATLKLTRLQLEMFEYEEPAELEGLLLSVGGTVGFPLPSTLQCLALDFCPGDAGEERKRDKNFPPLRLRSLAAILPRLANLKHLTLDAAPSADFLDAINPAALPKLVKFTVRDAFFLAVPCLVFGTLTTQRSTLLLRDLNL